MVNITVWSAANYKTSEALAKVPCTEDPACEGYTKFKILVEIGDVATCGDKDSDTTSNGTPDTWKVSTCKCKDLNVQPTTDLECAILARKDHGCDVSSSWVSTYEGS